MKRALLLLLAGASLAATAETINLEGKDYQIDVMTKREIGPGITHTRLRLPSYPLNVNVLTIDLNNEYNRIETTTGGEKSRGTELLVNAAARQSYKSHRALGGANANFWVVASQPEEKVYTGISRNASIRNGKMVVESNQNHDQWDGGTMRTGVVAVSYDKTAYVDYCTSAITVTNDKIGSLTVSQCNKGIHADELCMYNSFYGDNTAFLPIKVVNGKYDYDDTNDATEVILDLDNGQEWLSGRDITFVVKEVRTDAGHGTKGAHDLALVGRGANRDAIAKLAIGDKVTLKYSWTYNPNTPQEVTPFVEQAVGPNALVMRGGELTAHNTNETYNSQVYSRTGYGCSADGKTVYIIVIDKSTDPVYGTSAGCSTAKMCEIARWMGCSNMANFDAGGSAEMFINGKIENKTTEGTPRAVQNGWLVYSIAPEDAADYNTVARLEFDDYSLQAPVYASYIPKVIAYNRYGAVLNYDYKDFTLSCNAEAGSCNGTEFIAAGTPSEGTLTATAGEVSVSKPIKIVESQVALRIKNILIDNVREYPVEVLSSIGTNEYKCNPATMTWTIEDPSVAAIGADGVLRGLKEGKTAFSGKVGTFSDGGEITVEIPTAQHMSVAPWSNWTPKGSAGITNGVIAEDGTVSFDYGSPRDPLMDLSYEQVFYSLPDKLVIEFTPSVDLKSVAFDLRAANTVSPKLTTVKQENDELYPAGVKQVMEIPFENIGETSDLAIYPVSIKKVRFGIKLNSANKGKQNIQIHDFYGVYNGYTGVENVAATAAKGNFLSTNPAAAGENVTVYGKGLKAVDVYTTAGALVSSIKLDGEDNAVFQAPAAAGAYVVRATAAASSTSAILIVK